MNKRTLVALLASLVSPQAWPAGGDLDASFSADGRVLQDFGGRESIHAVAAQSDGKTVAVGALGGNFLVVRYTAAGALDTSFDGDGFALVDAGASDAAHAVAVQSDGRVVVAGSSSSGGFAVVRLNSNGSLDSGFGHGGIVSGGTYGSGVGGDASALVIDNSGRIVVVGPSNDGNFGIARLLADGSFDAAFSGDGRILKDFGGNDGASAVALRADGRIFVAGTAKGGSGSGTRADIAVAVYSPSGVEVFFGASAPNSPVTDIFGCADGATAIVVQPDDKVLVAGGAGINCLSGFTDTIPVVVRYDSNGFLDATFSGDGIATAGYGTTSSGGATSMALQLDGAIIVAGPAERGTHLTDFGLARLRSDGLIDVTFSGNGAANVGFGTGVSVPTAIALQPGDGRVLTVGVFKTFDANGALANTDVAIARQHAITCNGLNATRMGTNGADVLTGRVLITRTGTQQLVDVIHGMGGNDTIDGLGADDALCGGDGADTIRGGDGNDALVGGAGTDAMDGGKDADTCVAGLRSESDTFVNCETIGTGSSGLSGEWLRLEQHCSGSAVQPACQLTGRLSVFNPGEESTVVATRVSYFLSADSVLDAGDAFVGEAGVPVLGAGESHEIEFVERVAGSDDLLGLFVIAYVDATDLVSERNEANNVVPGLISGR